MMRAPQKGGVEVNRDRGYIAAENILDERYLMARPLVTRSRNGKGFERVNIITDSVREGSLFGGVGTALLFGVSLANRLDAQLRIITRTEKPDELGVFSFFKLYDIIPKKELQFKFEPCDDGGGGVEFSESELFITTSWWTTASTMAGVDTSKIIYLLQEDERMFYPAGDDWVRAHKIMMNEEIRIIVNTKLLFDHLVVDGFGNIFKSGLWFEPAFPGKIYRRCECGEDNDRKKFFFYARPNNPRNLFYLGLEVIERALMKGVINPAEWDIFFVGNNIPDVEMFGGIRPIKYENLSWREYSKMLGTIDVGLSLMSTPHPSYPPLDLAASGSVVVTNRFGFKQDLSNYSRNIFCSDLDVDNLVSAVKAAINFSKNNAAKNSNYLDGGISRSWDQAFQKVIDEIIGGVHAGH
jgi:hypothetical protein